MKSKVKFLNIVGARPQIIKAAAISRIVKEQKERFEELILHTGQHYDDNMSEVFFKELGIPKPHYNLNIGSGSHGHQTAQMISGIEQSIKKEKPDCVVLYGDTNSTLAGAIAASKLHVPVVHIEAGLRSFNKKMPEELNRIACDHMSTLLFVPTEEGINNLRKEGFDVDYSGEFSIDTPGVFKTGDIMYDNSMYYGKLASQQSTILRQLSLQEENFILTTIHRNSNTDDPARLGQIFSAIQKLSKQYELKIIVPLHPRTKKAIEGNLDKSLLEQITTNDRILLTGPASFLDMIELERNCKCVITDSGGVQKEAYFFEKPCIIARPQTEWVELVKSGAATLADANEEGIVKAYETFLQKGASFPPLFGDGNAATQIASVLYDQHSN